MVDRQGVRSRKTRALLFVFVLVCHVLLIVLAQRGLIRVPRIAEDPLEIFSVAPPPRSPVSAPRDSAAPRRHSIATLAAKPTEPDEASPVAPLNRSMLDIDWSAEAALAARHQTESANAAGPRSLDDHHGRKPKAGLKSGELDTFEWDYAATHRVETSLGVPIIHLGDRCVVGFLLILPFFGCGFGGEIPVNGDLFKHMHDEPTGSVPTPP